MPIINVQMLSGRSPAQKSALIAELADAPRRSLGVPEEALRIILTEVAPENWGVGGGSMAGIQSAPESVEG